MYIEVRCPVHNKPLYGNGQTSTHNLFKCPDCDYDGGVGAVREDLPERFMALATKYSKLKVENQKMRNALQAWVDVNVGAPNKYQWAKEVLGDI